MKKRIISGELAVVILFVVLMGFLVIFGGKLTGFVISDAVSEGVSGDKLDIEIENAYSPGDEVNLRIFLYDSENNKINREINFVIQDYYTDVIFEGKVNSGELKKIKLPENAIRGYWAVIAKYNGIEKKELFNVLELEMAEIKLEGDKLIIKNIGNIPYRKSIQISIGEYKETVLVPLEVGQVKQIRLTAPEGKYDVKVSDGSEENDIVFRGVGLTGNVIGLEKVDKSFLKDYPLVSLFLAALVLVTIVVVVLKFKKDKNKN